jgi:transcriptional regulator with XRE-family HTH domain
MLTENLSSQQAGAGSANISSIKQQVLEALKSSSEYRHAFIEEAIRSRLTAQINAMRIAEGWDYRAFAEKLGKKLSWAYRLEDPNSSAPTIPTLLEVAEVFDIGLDVRFRRFSELLDDATTLTPGSFLVPSFNSELRTGAFIKKVRKRNSLGGLKLVKKPKERRRRNHRFGPEIETGHGLSSGLTQEGDHGIKNTG